MSADHVEVPLEEPDEDFSSLNFQKNAPITTNKEIWGWYLYDAANSVFSSVVISAFIPLLANDMAKQASDETCRVQFGAINMRPASYASYFISFSVFIQALTFICISAMADYGNMRKKLLIATSILGSLLTISVSFFTSSSLYWVVGILIVLTNVCYGSSIVFYNAFLPLLVKSHPDYIAAAKEDKLTVEESLNNTFSSRGFIMGYISGVFLLLVSVPVVLLMARPVETPFLCPDYQSIDTDPTPGYRLAIALAGIFWFCVSFFTFFWVNPRPGPPLPPRTNYLKVSLLSLKSTFKHLKRLPNTLKFLLAYFIYSDGYSTVASVGILFANEDMQASTVTLLMMIIEVPLAALLGNVFWLWLKKKLGYETKTAIVINCCLFLLLPIYGLIGLFPVPFGLKNEWELHIFAVFYGFNLGSIQSFSRALMSTLTPPGHEAEFFGFFEISDKGSSWIGPLVVAAIVEVTGKLRWGLVYLFVAFIVPIPILLKAVSVSQGVNDVKEFSKAMDEDIMHVDTAIEQHELKAENQEHSGVEKEI